MLQLRIEFRCAHLQQSIATLLYNEKKINEKEPMQKKRAQARFTSAASRGVFDPILPALRSEIKRLFLYSKDCFKIIFCSLI